MKGDLEEKIALLYKCHIPPAFNISDLNDLLFKSDQSDKEILANVDENNVDTYGMIF